MSGALPPVPDLIPISALRKGSSVNNNNVVFEDDVAVKEVRDCAPCSSTQCEVMGEQRSRRTVQPAEAAATQIDTVGSRGADGAAPRPEPSRKTRTERHRKSDRRRDRERRKRSTSITNEPPTNPRVNPIFVWVRQKDNHIVEVKCEDYDKRNRILLTKTAQGWRAIPRTETLAPHKTGDGPKHKKPKKHGKIKKKSTAVQVDSDELICEKPPPASVNSEEEECSAQDDCQNKCDVTPLDNLLAVAELEFNQQIREEQWETAKEKEIEQEQINNMEQLDMFIEACTEAEPTETKTDITNGDCDYNEEEDNTLAMDDILTRLEQSLRSPDTLHSEITDIIKTTPEMDEKTEKPQETPTDLSTHKTNFTYEDMMPTDLSIPKCPSPPKRPPSQNSETIQSPQPSGIPAVPQSPDVYNKKQTNIYLESLLSPQKDPPKEPLDLGKSRESDSPKVTCSDQEVILIDSPPVKKIKIEDITLKTLLDNEEKEKPKNETPRLLELLESETPINQLKQILANASLNVPDPMLIPKDKLSQILCAPGKEIPKLLSERPELRLPEALAYPHLLQDPDILVITLSQLQTIVQKQSQTILVEKGEEAKKKSPPPPPLPHKPPNKPPTPSKEDPKTTKKTKSNENSSEVEAANAAFTQMMWLPYLNQLENAALSFGGNSDFLKALTTMFPGYSGFPSDLIGANRVPFPPPPFPLQPSLNYNPLELSMWQEAMLQANFQKNQFDFGKSLFGKGGGQNPYLHSRPNLQVPQFNPHHIQKYPKQKTGSPTTNKNFDQYKTYQQKLYENEKMLAQQRQKEIQKQQQEYAKQQELMKQQEMAKQQEAAAAAAAYQKPRVACKAFANVSNGYHQERRKSTGPIDLSGSNNPPPPPVSKLKVKQHLIDPANATRLLKHDEIPEVGSTTASIEDMQDAQKHLWHPLFGNQKSYTSPWNWTTVTAAGE